MATNGDDDVDDDDDQI